MPERARYMGFAFATADYLFEIDRSSNVVFSLGAASEFLPKGVLDMKGKPVGRFFQPSEGAKFATFATALDAGMRAGPFKLKLANGTDVAVGMFRLPDAKGVISCTMTKPGVRPIVQGADPKTGLARKDSFINAVADVSTAKDTLALVEVPELPKVCEKLGEDKAEKLMKDIGANLVASGAKAAGRISETAFGAVREGQQKGLLASAVQKALSDGGIDNIKVEETLVSLKGEGLSGEQRMLAVKYVMDTFAAKGKPSSDLTGAFTRLMDETEERLRAMTRTVTDGDFSLVFQPIVDLATGTVSHFEALTRFAPGTNTGDEIKFVEALGMSNAFDLAVAAKAVAAVVADSKAQSCIAFNISGATLSDAANFGVLAGFLARKRNLAPRLLIEITETAEITDLVSANKAVQGLREMGFKVGLDDFGAGAASLQYLHGLKVDFVKFDGSLVKKLGEAERDDMLLAGLVKLCKELGVETIAECIETDELRERVIATGFSHGQGRFLGDATAKPDAPANINALRPAKRQGVRESWG